MTEQWEVRFWVPDAAFRGQWVPIPDGCYVMSWHREGIWLRRRLTDAAQPATAPVMPPAFQVGATPLPDRGEAPEATTTPPEGARDAPERDLGPNGVINRRLAMAARQRRDRAAHWIGADTEDPY